MPYREPSTDANLEALAASLREELRAQTGRASLEVSLEVSQRER